jgi:hypothetical protein
VHAAPVTRPDRQPPCMVSGVSIAEIIDRLPSAQKLSGALWLTAPASHRHHIVLLNGRVGLADGEISEPLDHEHPFDWACRQWRLHDATPVTSASHDPLSWVTVASSGSRLLAHGATLLWGVELAADRQTHPLMLAHLVRMTHAGHLEEGVVTADGCVALQVRHSTRWSLVAA